MDYTGIGILVSNMITALCPRGIGAIVGASKPGTTATLDLTDVMQNCKKLIRVVEGDSGPEYISNALKDWACDQGITISYIEHGNPQQSAYVERYNRTMKYD